MFEETLEYFTEMETNQLIVAIVLWFLCLLMIWKMFDDKLMTLPIKFITSAVMLPLTFILTRMIANR